jgi:predicted metal-dependent phosphoesterase TrpH
MLMMTIDMHVHTFYSHDGYLSLRSLDAACCRKGLTAVAITDHDAIAGALEADGLFRAGRFRTPVIAGEEVTTSQGEIIGLFLREYIPPRMTLAETIEAIRAQGGLVYLNHPFGYERRSAQLALSDLEPLWDRIDIVEIFNGRNWSRQANQSAKDLGAEHKKPGGVGTDAHSAWEVGRSFVRMREFDRPQTFLAALRDAQYVCRPCPRTYRVLFKARKMLLPRPRPCHRIGREVPLPGC